MVSFTAPWDYQVSSGAPPAGKAYQNSPRTTLQINKLDHNAVDQTASLNLLTVNDTINCDGVTWTINSASLAGGIYTFGITPNTAASPVGVSNITLNHTTVPIGPLIVFPASASDANFHATPPMPIEPSGNSPPIIINPATHIPGEPLSKTAGNFPYTLVLPTFAFMPLVQGVKFNLSAHPPWKTAGLAEPVTPPPLLTMTRTPPFPAYPS